jgi:hypothetical protein
VPVYDGSGMLPDLYALRRGGAGDRPWVRSRSVFSPAVPVVRPIRYAELLGAWDYEGKLEARNWGPQQRAAVLEHRLNSPPGKMLRDTAFRMLEILRPALEETQSTRRGGESGADR